LISLLYNITGETEEFRAVKVPRQCPVCLLVKVGWKKGKALESEEGTVK
jgi:hypothetical protein